MSEKTKNEKQQTRRVIWGAAIALAGLLWALNILGAPIDDFLKGWWCFLILIPSAIAFLNNEDKKLAVAGLIVGVLLLFNSWGIINLAVIIALIAPVILIYVGVHMITQKNLKDLTKKLPLKSNKKKSSED